MRTVGYPFFPSRTKILDVSCGPGREAFALSDLGFDVVGIDISKKMLEVAKRESSHEKIEYINMSMTDIAALPCKFDFIYSSLAFHYIEDFEKLAADIYSLLNDNGCLLFSQEHPIVTATVNGNGHWNKDENGNRISYTFSNYGQEGMREHHWICDGVINYHRTMGSLITTLAKNGFIIDTVEEPTPEKWAIEKHPLITKEFLKPNFIIIKANKG